MTKICSKCGEEKSIDDFYKSSKGHICKLCIQEYQVDYKKADPIAYRERGRKSELKYRQNNPEKRAASSLKYREANREYIRKHENERNKKQRVADPIGYAVKKRKYFTDNIDRIKEVLLIRKENKPQWIWYVAYKKETPCLHCGENDPDELIFNYRNSEERNMCVSDMVHKFRSMEDILTEVAKCDLICKKCRKEIGLVKAKIRRKKARQEQIKLRRQWRIEYLLEHPCLHCGETDQSILHFHHRIIKEKIKNVSSMLSSTAPMKRILNEVAKCDILCKKCHVEVHRKYGKDMLKEETVK